MDDEITEKSIQSENSYQVAKDLVTTLSRDTGRLTGTEEVDLVRALLFVKERVKQAGFGPVQAELDKLLKEQMEIGLGRIGHAREQLSNVSKKQGVTSKEIYNLAVERLVDIKFHLPNDLSGQGGVFNLFKAKGVIEAWNMEDYAKKNSTVEQS